jgi:hypothetical protein
MADGDLQSLISGVDPTAAMQLQALQGQNIASGAVNPENWQGQGIFGGLARQMALGQGMDMARGGVNQAVQANLAAQPDLAAMMASPNPLEYPAQNPGMDPVARARALAQFGGPQARETMADAAYRAAAGANQGMSAQAQQLTNLAMINELRKRGFPISNLPPVPGIPAAPSFPVVQIGGGGSGTTGAGSTVLPPGTRLPPAQGSPYASGGHYPRPANPAAAVTPAGRPGAYYSPASF